MPPVPQGGFVTHTITRGTQIKAPLAVHQALLSAGNRGLEPMRMADDTRWKGLFLYNSLVPELLPAGPAPNLVSSCGGNRGFENSTQKCALVPGMPCGRLLLI